jgi:hypothetical protein
MKNSMVDMARILWNYIIIWLSEVHYTVCEWVKYQGKKKTRRTIQLMKCGGCWSRYRKNRRNFTTDHGEEGLPQVRMFFISSVEPNSVDLLGPIIAKLDCSSVWIF